MALSGGGDNGAFGAGLLIGWTEHGSRPEFEMVTGISTGALIAPFAFLGSEYDRVLRDVYTNTEPDEVFSPRSMLAALFDDGMADTTPLYRLIEKNITPELLTAVAEQWGEKGRVLMIATTNLDARRSVF
ncbi:MAG: patatin-like phospholipase family protein [Planctomycetota bacterium]